MSTHINDCIATDHNRLAIPFWRSMIMPRQSRGSVPLKEVAMKTDLSPIVLLLLVHIASSRRSSALAQDRVRIGVPLFPTVSYPVFIAQEKGLLRKERLEGGDHSDQQRADDLSSADLRRHRRHFRRAHRAGAIEYPGRAGGFARQLGQSGFLHDDDSQTRSTI